MCVYVSVGGWGDVLMGKVWGWRVGIRKQKQGEERSTKYKYEKGGHKRVCFAPLCLCLCLYTCPLHLPLHSPVSPLPLQVGTTKHTTHGKDVFPRFFVLFVTL